ncbi:MAG: DegV family protein [Eubacteriales bacterium]
MKIKIITDSANDLPNHILQDYDIDVLPLTVIDGSKEFRDGVDITPEELFKQMRQGTVFKTSQVTTNDYLQKFETFIQQGKPCIYVAFSSQLSGSYQASVIALEQLKEKYGQDVPVHIYDTKCASLGSGLVVIKAAQLAQQGKNIQEILKAIEFYSLHTEHIFTVFDLDYLYKGGRLKKSAAVVGNLLNLYPILDVENGNLHLIETVRGKKKHFKKVMELVEKRGMDLANQRIGIVYGDNLDIVEEIKHEFQERFNTKEFLVRPVGSVIGAHTGPEMFSLFFFNVKTQPSE